MKHLGGTDAVQHLDARRLAPERACGVGQALAGAHTNAQGRGSTVGDDLLHVGRHLPVKRGRCVADRRSDLAHQPGHALWRVGRVGKVDRGARPHRKNQQTAQSKGKRQRRRAHDNVIRRGLQHMARPRFAGSQHVAVSVDRGFGLARRARGECHQGNVGCRCRARAEVATLAGAQSAKVIWVACSVVNQHRKLAGVQVKCSVQLVAQRRIANGQCGLGFIQDVTQLFSAQQRHRGHCDQARFNHSQPRQRQAHRVASAQEHTVTRHQAMILHQQIRDAIDSLVRLRIGDGGAAGAQKGSIGLTRRDGFAEQRFNQIDLIWKSQFGQVKPQRRHLARRRHTVLNEGVWLGGFVH